MRLIFETLRLNGFRNNITISCLFFASLFSLSSVCGGLEIQSRNVESVDAEKYSELLAEFTIRSKKGDAEALNNLGTMYLKGFGVTQDYKQAARFFTSAAKRKLPAAMYHLGLIHLRGLGGKINLQLAHDWFLKAASLGDSDAQFSLGIILSSNKFADKDINMAMVWFEQAAKAGIPAAQYNLAILGTEKNGNERFNSKSLMWLERAAAKNHTQSILTLVTIYSENNAYPEKLNSAISKLIPLAEEGNRLAQHRLGLLYFLGKGLTIDYQESEFWLREAAFGGLTEAQNDLARIYLNSSDPDKLIEGYAWLHILNNVKLDEDRRITPYVEGFSSKKQDEIIESEKSLRSIIQHRTK